MVEKYKLNYLLIIIGTALWSLTMVKSGLVYSFGMGFWGPNGHDGIWHIALAKSLSDGSWNMPMFAGETLKNYHIGFDLILSIIHKLTGIGIITLYFQILPPVIAFFIGFFAYKFVYNWKKSHIKAFWATFFVYFGGSWGFLVTLLKNKDLNGESLFWSQQSMSTLINPPFAFSLLIIFAALWILIRIRRSGDRRLYILVTFLFGILIQIKVYAGLLVLAGLFAAGIWQMVKRRDSSIFKVFAGVSILSILLFSAVTNDLDKTILFQPFWFLEQMVSSPDRFYWPKMASALANYKLAGNWLKGILAYGLTFIIFWFGNLGIRIVKEPQFFWHLKNFKKLTYIEIFLYSIIAAGVLVPTFFIQQGTPWNTIQFMYYSLMIAGILAGIALGEFMEKSKPHISIIVSTVLLILTVLIVASTLKHYLPERPPAKITKQELEALKFLGKQPEGVVLTQHFNQKLADAAINTPPRPLYLYESTAYVTALSGKVTYLEDQVNLEITGFDWKVRRSEVEKFFTDPTYDGKYELLEKKNIEYVYVIKSIQDEYKDLHLEPNKIFENDEVIIYKKSI